MAIKVSGNTVISDGENIVAGTFDTTNISANGASLSGVAPSAQIIQPVNVSPADGATDVSLTPTLEVTNFEPVFDNTHANTQFQVSTASDFSSTVVDTFTGANTTLVAPSSLSDGTEHFFRAKFIDNNGCCSAFSTATSFTTAPLPSTLGESICGGFYMGTICAASSCYYLIMAPNATGCAACQWKTTNTGGFNQEACDGYGNTYDCLASATFPAGNWTATRTIGSFSDWYLPAICELSVIYTNSGSAPAGEGFVTTGYWSSTEVNSGGACLLAFSSGEPFDFSKTNVQCVRAIRRVAFP